MVFMPYMAELMHHHVFDETDRRHHEPYIKIQIIFMVATPPSASDISQSEWWRFYIENQGIFLNFLSDYAGSLVPVPVLHQFPDRMRLTRPG